MTAQHQLALTNGATALDVLMESCMIAQQQLALLHKSTEKNERRHAVLLLLRTVADMLGVTALLADEEGGTVLDIDRGAELLHDAPRGTGVTDLLSFDVHDQRDDVLLALFASAQLIAEVYHGEVGVATAGATIISLLRVCGHVIEEPETALAEIIGEMERGTAPRGRRHDA